MLKRYMVLRFHAEKEPYDFVDNMGYASTRKCAERKRIECGPSLKEWRDIVIAERVEPPYYYEVIRRPRKLLAYYLTAKFLRPFKPRKRPFQ